MTIDPKLSGYIAVDEGAMTQQQFAMLLITRIREYWKARGHNVSIWSERAGDDDRKIIYSVRSNMVNGLPSLGSEQSESSNTLEDAQ